MLVGAAEECDLVMAKLTPQGAGERVRGQCLVGAADVRRPITVENCGSDMDSLAHWLLRARRTISFQMRTSSTRWLAPSRLLASRLYVCASVVSRQVSAPGYSRGRRRGST